MEDINSELNEQKRKVDFNSYDMSVKELISMVNDGLIDIAPEYQRQFRWDAFRQSTLIESIFLGIPVPSLFMSTNPDGTWEVIDGVQRLSSIINFAAEKDSSARKKIKKEIPLQLCGLKKMKSFNEKDFKCLPRSLQIDFLLKPLKITTLSDKSDKSIRFDLFERLNTGGIKLSDQEIRSCIFRGQFNDFLKRLSLNNNFRRVVKLSKNSENDGTREELVLRFFATLNNKNNFDHSVVDFLNDYMNDSCKNFDYETNERIFNNVFTQLSNLTHGMVKSRTSTITSVVLFEAVSVGAAEVLQKKGSINISSFYDWVTDKDFNKLITGATNSKPKLLARIEFCRSKFSE